MSDLQDRSPLQEDSAAHQLAASLGFELIRRYRAIEIVNERALIEAGYVVKKPKLDFSRIAAALGNGELVPGAKWRGMEYVLRGKE